MRFFYGLLIVCVFSGHTLADELSECRRISSKYDATVEHKLWDGTRVDLLTPTHAIEVDWASKWAEGIGQALYYSAVTNKRPGVILLIKNEEQERQFCYRLQTVCEKLGIDYWFENVPAKEDGQSPRTSDIPLLPPPFEIVPAPR